MVFGMRWWAWALVAILGVLPILMSGGVPGTANLVGALIGSLVTTAVLVRVVVEVGRAVRGAVRGGEQPREAE